jgi:hypothetical protein
MGIKVTPEFKQEVMCVALTSGLTRKQVASDFKLVFQRCAVGLKKSVMQAFKLNLNMI